MSEREPSVSVVRVWRAWPAPVAKEKVVRAFPAFTARVRLLAAKSASTVEPKLTSPSFAALSVVMVTFAPRTTGPVSETLLDATSPVVTFPPSVTVPLPVEARDRSAVVPPAAPPKPTVEVPASTDRPWAPAAVASIVELKLTGASVVVRVEIAATVPRVTLPA